MKSKDIVWTMDEGEIRCEIGSPHMRFDVEMFRQDSFDLVRLLPMPVQCLINTADCPLQLLDVKCFIKIFSDMITLFI